MTQQLDSREIEQILESLKIDIIRAANNGYEEAINDDVKPFVHGEEGTHSACDRRLKAEGDQAKCCYCSPHKDCELLPTPKNTKEEEL